MGTSGAPDGRTTTEETPDADEGTIASNGRNAAADAGCLRTTRTPHAEAVAAQPAGVRHGGSDFGGCAVWAWSRPIEKMGRFRRWGLLP